MPSGVYMQQARHMRRLHGRALSVQDLVLKPRSSSATPADPGADASGASGADPAHAPRRAAREACPPTYQAACAGGVDFDSACYAQSQGYCPEHVLEGHCDSSAPLVFSCDVAFKQQVVRTAPASLALQPSPGPRLQFDLQLTQPTCPQYTAVSLLRGNLTLPDGQAPVPLATLLAPGTYQYNNNLAYAIQQGLDASNSSAITGGSTAPGSKAVDGRGISFVTSTGHLINMYAVMWKSGAFSQLYGFITSDSTVGDFLADSALCWFDAGTATPSSPPPSPPQPPSPRAPRAPRPPRPPRPPPRPRAPPTPPPLAAPQPPPAPPPSAPGAQQLTLATDQLLFVYPLDYKITLQFNLTISLKPLPPNDNGDDSSYTGAAPYSYLATSVEGSGTITFLNGSTWNIPVELAPPGSFQGNDNLLALPGPGSTVLSGSGIALRAVDRQPTAQRVEKLFLLWADSQDSLLAATTALVGAEGVLVRCGVGEVWPAPMLEGSVAASQWELVP